MQRSKREKQFLVRVNQLEFEAVRMFALENNVSSAEAVRWILRKHFNMG